MDTTVNGWAGLPASLLRSIGMATALAISAGGAAAQNAGQASDTAPQSVAGDSLQEVVVTAERRSENLQRTPVAVSVRDGADLLSQGKFTVEQILEDVPSVNMTPAFGAVFGVADSPSTAISIRGVQANGGLPGNYASIVPAVALYVDGVYNGLGGNYDLDRVEVLRGPQGTLYGRSATAGVVNVHTTDPSLGSFGGSAAVELGSYDLQHYSGALNLPLGDRLALRVSANYYKREGWDAPIGQQVGPISDERIKLLFKPNDNLSLMLGVALQDAREHQGERFGMVIGPESDDVTFTCSICVNLPIYPGYNQTRQYWGKLDWDLGFATLTYVPALRTFTQHNTAVFMKLTRVAPSIIPLDVPHDYFHTEELRLTSNSTSPLQWQTGVFYYRNTVEFTKIATSGFVTSGADPEHKLTNQMGLFGEATYSLATNTKLTAGVRGDYTKVRTVENACTGTIGTPTFICRTLSADEGTSIWRNFTYKARLEQELTPSNLVYGSISSAFLPGDVSITTGVDSSGNIVLINAPYETQTLTSFELGSKNRFLDDRLQLNGSVFYYRYGGYQVAGVVGVGPGNSPLFNTVSSPTRMVGAELEAEFQLSRNDRLALNVGYTNAYFVDQSATFLAAVADTHVAGVVPWTVNPSYSHTFHFSGQRLTLLAEGLYRAGYQTIQLNTSQIGSGYGPFVSNKGVITGNLSATWNPTDNFSLSAYARNIADERYKTTINAGTGPDPRDNIALLSEPRTYGVVLGMRF